MSMYHHVDGISVRDITSFEILKLKEPHTCHKNSINIMLTIIKVEISIKIVTIHATIYKDFFYNILYKKAWLAK